MWVATTIATVTTITAVSLLGERRRWLGLMLFQSKVLTATMIMTATSAAMGMAATRSPKARMPTMRKMPAARVESRVRPPDFTLIMDWPIMAQPAMPPRKPVATFAMPWPRTRGPCPSGCR